MILLPRFLGTALFLTVFVRSSTGGKVIDATGCSSRCTLDFDKTLHCWNGSLRFYEEAMVGGLRQYVNIMTNIGLWQRRHQNNVDFDQLKTESLERMKKIEPGNIEDEDDIIEVSDYITIVEQLIKLSSNMFDIISAQDYTEGPLEVSCPQGCEKSWNPWFWMFFISASVNAILALASLTLVCLLDKRDTEEARLEIAECEVVKLQPQDQPSSKKNCQVKEKK